MNEQNLSYDADQTEFESLRYGSAIVDNGAYNERVASALDDYATQDGQDRPTWHEEDLTLDSFVGGIHEEIKRRVSLMGDAYPFKLDKNTLYYEERNKGFYEFLLAICNVNNFKGKHKHLPRLFERTTTKLIATYLGRYAQSLHTGFPRDSENGLNFQEAMQEVGKCSGEFRWEPEDSLDPSSKKDEGVDFVIWLKHADKRTFGQIFILGQCACGNNWDSKWSELQVNKIEKWFHPMTIIPPVRAFATPYHVTDSALKEASREAGLFFDRARLTMILDQAGDEIFDEQIQNCMRDLTDYVLNNP